jgi:hypothetical protein
VLTYPGRLSTVESAYDLIPLKNKYEIWLILLNLHTST